jgi:hypothetical protein
MKREHHRGRHAYNQGGNFVKKKPHDGAALAISVAITVVLIFVLTAVLAGS